MPLYIDPVCIEAARVVSGIAAGFAEHGVYRSDGSPVISGTLVQGKKVVQGAASQTVLHGISDVVQGEWVYGGCVYGHFGHLLLETFARLSVFSEFDQPVLFTSLNHTRNALFWSFVDVLGLPRSRIKVVDHPSIVERLIVLPPDFRIRHGINISFLESFERLADDFAARNNLRHNSDRVPVYLSRSQLSKGRKYFFGEKILEDALRAQGCDIVYTEKMSLSDQISLAITRSHIIGFAGSAMHTLVFGRGRKQVTYLSTHPVHVNFWMIESLKRNLAREIIVDAVTGNAARANGGPSLLTKSGIAAAASVLGHSYSEDAIDPAAYAACVEDYDATLAALGKGP